MSAIFNMDAPLSVFIAIMYLEFLIPVVCWDAPEIPHAMYSFGEIILPLAPISLS